MLQNTHPTLFYLGGGWFKLCWLKPPGPPARQPLQQVTADRPTLSPLDTCQLVTTVETYQGQGYLCGYM
eukprot:3166515-Amphidinium_carterae.1